MKFLRCLAVLHKQGQVLAFEHLPSHQALQRELDVVRVLMLESVTGFCLSGVTVCLCELDRREDAVQTIAQWLLLSVLVDPIQRLLQVPVQWPEPPIYKQLIAIRLPLRRRQTCIWPREAAR